MQAKQQHGHYRSKQHPRTLRLKTGKTRPFPGTQGHDQANKQRKAAALEQEKAAQGNGQQDKCSDDSLFKH